MQPPGDDSDMRCVLAPLWLVVLPLAVATGCVRWATKEFVAPNEQMHEDSAPKAGEMREVLVAQDKPGEEDSEPVASTVLALPRRDAKAEPLLFHLGAGYGALGRVDLTPCREQGLAPGYLHMRVTFRNSGRVVRAAVESPVAPPDDALACIGEQLEMSMIPEFEGGDVTLSKSLFVN
jgi:hypothetical protein